jgi:hypothetical protein
MAALSTTHVFDVAYCDLMSQYAHGGLPHGVLREHRLG